MAKSNSVEELCDAVEQGNDNHVRSIINAGIDLDQTDRSRHQTPLICATACGKTEIALLLLNSGADPTARPTGYRKDKPLHVACAHGNYEVAETLIELGADVNGTMTPHNEAGGRTPLMNAAESGSLPVAILLVDAGAKVDAIDDRGLSAYAHATDDALRDFLTNKLAEQPSDASPGQLAAAAIEENLDRAKSLLDAGADPDDLSPDGESALIKAVFRLDLKMVKLLIEGGANVNFRTAKGKLPLTAHPNMKTRMAKLLLENGANPNAETIDGRTAMRWAVASATKLQVQAMFDAGGTLDLSVEQQQSLLETVRRHNRGVLPILQERFGASEQPVDRIRAQVKDFAKLAEADEFQAEATRIGEILGRQPAKWKRRKGVTNFYKVGVLKHLAKYYDESIDPDDFDAIERLFSRFSGEVHQRGYVLIMSGLPSESGRCSVLLFPTSEKYAVIAAMGTNAANYGRDTNDIINWLMEMERENPFRLTDASHDLLGGTFVAPIKNAEELTKRMIEFCPNMTDFAAASADEWTNDEVIATMTTSIVEERMFAFWWD